MDPLPILDAFDRSNDRKKRRDEGDETLVSLVERA
jgi:hypothetical protein